MRVQEKAQTMSNFEYSEKAAAGVLLPVQRETERGQSLSLAASVKNVVTKFVTWIDGVDVDGQQYWN